MQTVKQETLFLVGNEWDKSDLHYASSSEILNRASTEIRIKAIFAVTGAAQNSLGGDRSSCRTLLIKIATIKIFTVPNNHSYAICTTE